MIKNLIIGLIAVFGATLTGRQNSQKLQSVFVRESDSKYSNFFLN